MFNFTTTSTNGIYFRPTAYIVCALLVLRMLLRFGCLDFPYSMKYLFLYDLIKSNLVEWSFSLTSMDWVVLLAILFFRIVIVQRGL